MAGAPVPCVRTLPLVSIIVLVFRILLRNDLGRVNLMVILTQTVVAQLTILINSTPEAMLPQTDM